MCGIKFCELLTTLTVSVERLFIYAKTCFCLFCGKLCGTNSNEIDSILKH
jgi:hypothetical protein